MSYDDEDDVLDPDTTREDVLDIIYSIAIEAHERELITPKEYLLLLTITEVLVTKAKKAPTDAQETTSYSGNVIVLPTPKNPKKPH